MAFPGIKAKVDLSEWQFKAVKMSDSYEVDKADAAADVPCGILQDAPGAGAPATVASMGDIAKAIYEGTISAGAFLTNSATTNKHGWLVPTTTDEDHVIAFAYVDGTDGEVHDVLVIGPQTLSAS